MFSCRYLWQITSWLSNHRSNWAKFPGRYRRLLIFVCLIFHDVIHFSHKNRHTKSKHIDKHINQRNVTPEKIGAIPFNKQTYKSSNLSVIIKSTINTFITYMHSSKSSIVRSHAHIHTCISHTHIFVIFMHSTQSSVVRSHAHIHTCITHTYIQTFTQKMNQQSLILIRIQYFRLHAQSSVVSQNMQNTHKQIHELFVCHIVDSWTYMTSIQLTDRLYIIYDTNIFQT